MSTHERKNTNFDKQADAALASADDPRAGLQHPARLGALRKAKLLDTLPEPSIDRVTQLATRLLRANASIVSFVDADREFFKSTFGLEESWSSRREIPLSQSIAKHVLKEGLLAIEDLRSHPTIDMHPALGAVSFLGVPLRDQDGFVLGAFCVMDAETRTWSPDERATLEALATTVETEIRLRAAHDELRHQRELLSGEERVLEPLARGAPLYEVLEKLTLLAESLSSGMKSGVLLFEPETQTLHHGSGPNLPDAYNAAIDGLRIGQAVGSCGTAAYTKTPVFVDDISTHPYWEAFRDLAAEHCLRACWSQPILASDDRLLGTFSMYHSSPRMPLTWEHELIRRLAHLAGLAIERHRADEELRSAKVAAESANHAKSHFLANMSHEIRTPLAAILGFSDLITSERATPEMRKTWSERIRSNGTHLMRLIDEILDLSKVEAGHLKVRREPLDLRKLLEETCNVLMPQAARKMIPIRVRIEENVPDIISSDYVRLKQILLNVVGNAVKFTEEGSVEVVVRLLDRHEVSHPRILAVEVRDTGAGLSPEQAQKLFRPFVQADASHTRKFGGTGLGLALSRRLARHLGGDVILKESSAGVGSTFMVTIDPGLKEDQISSFGRGDVTKSLEGMTVLVVEDAADNQALMRIFLEKAGARVDIASNGAEGANMAPKTNYDVVLMDIQMPIMDGFMATGQLRSHGYEKPIIALTAHAMTADKEKCLANGFTGYMTKPVDYRTLTTHLAEVRRKAAQH